MKFNICCSHSRSLPDNQIGIFRWHSDCSVPCVHQPGLLFSYNGSDNRWQFSRKIQVSDRDLQILLTSCFCYFRTILYLSCVYATGSVLIAVGAIPSLNLPAKMMTILGLLLIGVGSGGIKPCVAAFGGDQFKIPEQAKQLATFFSLFYFSINAGSLISTYLMPILREDVHCFGDLDCFSLAFGIPGALMIISIIVFISGRALYNVKKPSGNVIVRVAKCIFVSLKICYLKFHLM